MVTFLIFLLATIGAAVRLPVSHSGWAPVAVKACPESASENRLEETMATGLPWWAWGASRAARAASVGRYQESGQAAPETIVLCEVD